MSDVRQKGNLIFKKTNPIDKSDPGFRITGHRLRWVAATQTEDRMGRIWVQLRKSDLPPDFLRQMKEGNRDVFNSNDGNTIRNRELVLAYAPDDEVKLLRQELDREARDRLSVVTSKAAPGGNRSLTVDEATMTKVSTSEFFDN